MEAKDTVLNKYQIELKLKEKGYNGDGIEIGTNAQQALEAQAELTWDLATKAERERHLRFIRKYIDNCGNIGDLYKVKGSHEILPQWLPLIALLDELTGGPEEW